MRYVTIINEINKLGFGYVIIAVGDHSILKQSLKLTEVTRAWFGVQLFFSIRDGFLDIA